MYIIKRTNTDKNGKRYISYFEKYSTMGNFSTRLMTFEIEKANRFKFERDAKKAMVKGDEIVKLGK